MTFLSSQAPQAGSQHLPFSHWNNRPACSAGHLWMSGCRDDADMKGFLNFYCCVGAHSCFGLHLCVSSWPFPSVCRRLSSTGGRQLRPRLFIWKLPIPHSPSFSPLPRPLCINTEMDSQSNWTNTEIWRALSGSSFLAVYYCRHWFPATLTTACSSFLCFLHLTVWISLLLSWCFCSACIFHVRQLAWFLLTAVKSLSLSLPTLFGSSVALVFLCAAAHLKTLAALSF